ncbi:MAG: hypothetical protein E6Q97_24295 [Desulfurellales bacterium]|nr:MAG: hypothetical protein E6Q97_24295 [Desulfurellales bacterium]
MAKEKSKKVEDNRDVFEKALEEDRAMTKAEDSAVQLAAILGGLGGVGVGGGLGRIINRVARPKTYKTFARTEAIGAGVGGAGGFVGGAKYVADRVAPGRKERREKLYEDSRRRK